MAVSPAFLAFEEFARHPAKVGSPFPATPRLVHRVLDRIDWCRVDVLVEYGPGTGVFTVEALRRLKPGSTLIAIEPGERFVAALRDEITDPKLIVVKGWAQDVERHLGACGQTQVDCVLTGLPFSTLADAEAETILRCTARVLASDGVLAAYQMRRAIAPLLERHFAAIEHGFEWWNIPPCHLYWARPGSRA